MVVSWFFSLFCMVFRLRFSFSRSPSDDAKGWSISICGPKQVVACGVTT